MMHVFEHFPNPFAILGAMKKQLSDGGRIVIEVPNFGGYHSQHLFFYTGEFFQKLASDFGLIVTYCDIGNVIRVVLLKADKCVTDVQNIFSGDIQSMVKAVQADFDKKVNLLNSIIADKKKIFWWGAGSASVIFLNQLDENVLKSTEIVVVDGDRSKSGNFIPGLEIEVLPFDILKSEIIEHLVIASSFHKEIKQTISKNNIQVENYYVFE